MRTRIVQTPMLFRAVSRGTVDTEARTVELSFSSEEPVLRTDFFEGERFYEVLDHSPRHADLSELNNKAPFLDEHHGPQVGVVENARLDKKVGRATVRLSRNPRPQELLTDIEDGIRTKISFGYSLTKELERIPGKKDEPETRRFAWIGREISSVSMAADNTIGVGRSADATLYDTEVIAMDDDTDVTKRDDTGADDNKDVGAGKVQVEVAHEEGKAKERKRCQDINQTAQYFARKHPQANELARKAIGEDWSFDEFRGKLDEIIIAGAQRPDGEIVTSIGMERGDIENYSMLRVLDALIARHDGKSNWEKLAPHEVKCSTAVFEQLEKKGQGGREIQGLLIPWDVQRGSHWGVSMADRQRAFDLGLTHYRAPPMDTTENVHLVGTDHLAQAFIEALRPNVVLGAAGMTMLPGLVGNVEIPKQTGTTTWYYLAEDADATDSEVPTDTVSLTPTTIAGAVPITRRLTKQSSPAVEQIVRNDLILGAAETIDNSGLNGTGANDQPTGIINTAGIGSVTFTSLGNPTWAEVVEQETDVASANAQRGAGAYVMPPAMVGAGKTQPKDAGSGMFIIENNAQNGYPVLSTTQMAANTSLFGHYSQLLFGMWGVLDLTVDTATKVKSGGIVMRAFQDIDFAVRHPQAWSLGSGGT